MLTDQIQSRDSRVVPSTDSPEYQAIPFSSYWDPNCRSQTVLIYRNLIRGHSDEDMLKMPPGQFQRDWHRNMTSRH